MVDVFPKYARGSLEIPSNYGYFHSPRKFHAFCLGGHWGPKSVLTQALIYLSMHY